MILRHLTKEGFNEAYIKFDNTGITSIEPVNEQIEVEYNIYLDSK